MIFKYIYIYMDKELIKDQIYEIIDQFNERKIIYTKFFSIHLTKYTHIMMEMVEHVRYCLLTRIYRHI